MARPKKTDPTQGSLGVREKIIKNTLELSEEKCFASIGVREIAARSGCTLSMISYHFESKEGLLRAIILDQVDKLRHRIAIEVDPADTLPLIAKNIVRLAVEQICSNGSFFRIIWRDIIMTKSHPLLSHIKEIEYENVKILTKLFSEICRLHNLTLKCDPRILILTILGTTLFWRLGLSVTSEVFCSDTDSTRLSIQENLERMFVLAFEVK